MQAGLTEIINEEAGEQEFIIKCSSSKVRDGHLTMLSESYFY